MNPDHSMIIVMVVIPGVAVTRAERPDASATKAP
jgi:hypothetical protein